MTVSTVDVLLAARDLYAQAPSHVPYPGTPEYGTHCMLSATWQACAELSSDDDHRGPSFLADEALRQAANTDLLAQWNAEHSTEEVLAAFDRAIEAERAKAVTA